MDRLRSERSRLPTTMVTTPQRSPLRVLVSGAGIGGPVLAFWLSKAGISITVVERAPQLRKEGQTVDIKDEGVTIVRWMGLEEAIKARTTREAGVKFVDSQDNTWAAAPVQPEGISFTCEIEIVRGELANVFYGASRDQVEYIFGDSIESIDESEQGASVRLASGTTLPPFDMVIVAEGLSSRTRAKAFSEDIRAPIRPLYQWAASFSYNSYKKDKKGEEWARWYNAIKRRVILVRPDGSGRVRATVMWMDESDNSRLMASSRTSQAQQKQYCTDLFRDAGWESDKIMAALVDADDFYIQEVAQAKCEAWSRGRVALVGDCAFCPSPVSGMGTTAAIVGAYVLAAEIVKNQEDHRAAFTAYESFLRPWIKKVQSLPPGVPGLACPETIWGIRLFYSVVYLVTLAVKSGLLPLLSRFVPSFLFGKPLALPDPALFNANSKRSDFATSFKAP